MPLRIPQASKRAWLSSLFALAIAVGAAGGYVAWLRVSAPEAGAAIVNGQDASNALGQYDDDPLSAPDPVYTKGASDNAPNRLGMYGPTDVAVDAVNHRLFVSDEVNSRVLVYNLNTSDALLDRIPDNVLGQANFYSNGYSVSQSTLVSPHFVEYDGTNNRLFVSDSANRVLVFDVTSISDGENATGVLGQSTFTASSASTSQSRMNLPLGLAYDSTNSRLFVAQDTSNRITVYDVATVTDGEDATGVLGQGDFTTSTAAISQAGMNSPHEIAYDAANTRLFVADRSNNRVTTFNVSTVINGENAVNVLGQGDFTTATAANTQAGMNAPLGLAYDSANSRLFVGQGASNSNRVTVYDLTAISDGENATGVLGQSDFTSGGEAATQSGLAGPFGLAYVSSASRLYVADASNQRVIAYDVSTVTNGENAADALGQTDGSLSAPGPIYTKGVSHDSPNRLGYGNSGVTDVEIDAVTHRMFVPDFSNNRVLVYNLDSNDNLLDRVPDNVLGQSNFYTGTAAFTQAGMYDPSGLAYDAANSRLFVGQTSRVTVYDVASISDGENALNVLGQSTFTGSTQATTQAGMNNPFNLAYDSANSLLFVGDYTNRRVTTYNLADGITNGENATNVLGQADFTSSTAATTQAGLNLIKGIAYDSANTRLYVADGANNRVIVYDMVSINNGENAYRVLGQADFTSGGAATTQSGLSSPSGVTVDTVGSRLFVSDQGNSRVMAYDIASISDGEDATHVLGQTSFTSSSYAATQAKLNGPTGLTYDSLNGRLWVADTANRRVLSYDLAALGMSSAVTGDDDADGKIDRVVVTFNQDLDGSTVTGADFSVTSPGYTVASASETSAGVVTIMLTEGGSADTAAAPTVNIVGSVQNVGNTESAVSGSVLATDGAAPVVMSVSPADSATGVAVNADLVITFSEAMDTGFAEGTEFSVSPDPGSFSAAWTVGNTIVTLSHSSSHFAASSVITVTTAEGQIAAAAGSPSGLITTGPQDGDWSFTTGTGASCPFTDNDSYDANAAVGTFELNANYSVPSSTGAYDCTSPALFVIPSTKTLTLQGNTSTGAIARMNFTNLQVNSGGTITSNVQGCTSTTASGYGPDGSNVCTASTAGTGPNVFNATGGGGYGGAGGASSSPSAGGVTYGSATAPTLFGSTGGASSYVATAGGTGGGVVRLDVSGTFTHDGSITANGGNGYIDGINYHGTGGGSGGAIYVTAGTMDGTTGTFAANGGDGRDALQQDSGGGGGGRIAIEYQSGSFSFDSSDFSVAGGSGPAAAADGAKGTVYVVDTQGTGGATDDDVKIYHGFTYTDADYSTNTWYLDPDADNQYCQNGISSGATPSVTVPGNLTFDGTLNCSSTISSFVLTSSSGNITTAASSSFTAAGAVTFSSVPTLTLGNSSTISSSGAITLTATTDFSMGSSVTITDATAGTDINLNIPTGDDQSWSGLTVNGPAKGKFIVDDAIDITLSGSSAINANVEWTNVVDLAIASGSSIAANSKGCTSTTASGYGPDGSNVCTASTAGTGPNVFNATGGGGYGGAGGASSLPSAGGVTYGSATAPTLFGSTGGASSYVATAGGTGGGVVRLDVSGTFTHDGSITANGGNGYIDGINYHGTGGGSGGAIYVTAGTYARSTACSPLNTGNAPFRVVGGDGRDASQQDSGGGGGGRISVEYASDASTGCELADLSGQEAILATGGTGPGAAADGSNGTLNLDLTDDPPAVSAAVAASPSNPTVNQETVISATFTDDNGVNQIKLFLDGTTDPTHLIKTCTFSPAESPATCSMVIGPGLSDGSHTIRAAARDTASQTTNSDSSFTVGSFTTSGTMTFSRLKAGLADVDFSLSFDVVGPDTGALVVTFPSGFTVTQAFTSGTCSGGGTVGSFGYTATTLTGTKTGCLGTVTLSGAKVTNHATPGTYTLTWTNDIGEGSFTIVDDDQVNVTGQVEQSLTFDLDVAVADAGSTAPYAISFGDLTPNAVASSGTTHASVWLDLSTNATNGAVVTVRNLNGSDGLVSSSVPADKIANAAAAMSSSTPNYGICVISVAQTAGGPLQKAGDYASGTCAANGTTNDVKGLTTTNASILSTANDPVDAARARVSVNVNATSLTPAHPDYQDAITFIATATY